MAFSDNNADGGSGFRTDWDIDSYFKEHEPEEHWLLRRGFMEAHKNKFPEDRLACLAQVFTNVEFLGCKYADETMRLVAELSEDLAKEFREQRAQKLQHFSAMASNAAEEQVKFQQEAQEHLTQQSDNVPSTSREFVSNQPNNSETAGWQLSQRPQQMYQQVQQEQHWQQRPFLSEEYHHQLQRESYQQQPQLAGYQQQYQTPGYQQQAQFAGYQQQYQTPGDQQQLQQLGYQQPQHKRLDYQQQSQLAGYQWQFQPPDYQQQPQLQRPGYQQQPQHKHLHYQQPPQLAGYQRQLQPPDYQQQLQHQLLHYQQQPQLAGYQRQLQRPDYQQQHQHQRLHYQQQPQFAGYQQKFQRPGYQQQPHLAGYQQQWQQSWGQELLGQQSQWNQRAPYSQYSSSNIEHQSGGQYQFPHSQHRRRI